MSPGWWHDLLQATDRWGMPILYPFGVIAESSASYILGYPVTVSTEAGCPRLIPRRP